LARTVEHHDFDGARNVREVKNGIARPIAARDVRAVECHRLEKCPAQRLKDSAFDLVSDPVGIDGLAAVDRSDHTQYPRGTMVAIHADFDRDCQVGRKILVPCEREALAAAVATVLSPTEALCGSADHRYGTGIIEMSYSQLDGIGPPGTRQLVQEAFNGEHVEMSPERSQRRDSERHRRNEAVIHLQGRYAVERQRVAIATTRRQRERLGRRGTEAPLEEPTWHQLTRPAGAGGVSVARDFVFPTDDVAPFTERAAHASQHRGTDERGNIARW